LTLHYEHPASMFLGQGHFVTIYYATQHDIPEYSNLERPWMCWEVPQGRSYTVWGCHTH